MRCANADNSAVSIAKRAAGAGVMRSASAVACTGTSSENGDVGNERFARARGRVVDVIDRDAGARDCARGSHHAGTRRALRGRNGPVVRAHQRTGTSIASLLAPLARPPRQSNPNVLASVPQAELRNNAVVDDEQEALAAVALGAPCLEIKTPSPTDLERVRRIARAVPNVRLRLDANRGWPRADVRTLLASLTHLPIEYIEEPCAEAHALLGEPLFVKIALDESLIELSREEVARALQSPHLGAIVLKPTLLGGFVRCLASLPPRTHTASRPSSRTCSKARSARPHGGGARTCDRR